MTGIRKFDVLAVWQSFGYKCDGTEVVSVTNHNRSKALAFFTSYPQLILRSWTVGKFRSAIALDPAEERRLFKQFWSTFSSSLARRRDYCLFRSDSGGKTMSTNRTSRHALTSVFMFIFVWSRRWSSPNLTGARTTWTRWTRRGGRSRPSSTLVSGLRPPGMSRSSVDAPRGQTSTRDVCKSLVFFRWCCHR